MRKKSNFTVRFLHVSLTLIVILVLFTKETDLKKNLYSGHLYYVSVYLLLVVVSFVFYFITSCIDPGYVHVGTFHPEAHNLNTDEEEVKILINFPQETSENENPVSNDCDAKQIRHRHCGFCAIVQPLRAKHCEECMRCIHRYDHHCPWIGNCVGEKNHRYFLMFLFLETVLISWSIYTCVKAFHSEYAWSNWFKSNWIFLILTIFLFVCVLVVGLLWICHSYMMLTAQTTWEFMSRPRISYLKKLPLEANPFDQGYFRNMITFLCYCNLQKWDDLYGKETH